MLNPGLEGVIAAETRISGVDGEHGRLVIAGLDVESLAGSSFEDAAARVLAAGGLEVDHVHLGAQLAAARADAFARLPHLGDALRAGDGMTALRAAIAQLPSTASDADDAIRAIAATAVYAAAWHRTRRGAAPIAPALPGHAADYLAMTGVAASPATTRALEAYLVTVMDHGMNASTFTARVVASTGSDLISAVVAALGALKGPLHGGAPGPVLDMLDAIGTPDRADAWLRGELAAGRRIMGMGHRVYRVRDPRAAVLERALRDLDAPRLPLARAVEDAAAALLHEHKPDRPMAANVELATAILLDAIGLDRDQFSPTFAIGRAVGWSAHVREQRRGRLIRPASRYVGEGSC
jgi:citrate synthase|nr:citrate synthase [Kofleriaceae bacterium]